MPATAGSDGRMIVSARSVRRTAPSIAGPVERSQGRLRAEDDGRLRPGLGRSGRAGQDGGLDDIGHGRPAAPRIDQVVPVDAVPTDPAMDARARGRQAEPGRRAVGSRRSAPGRRGRGRRRRGRRSRRSSARRRARRIAMSPSASTSGRSGTDQQIQRPIGQPALGDAVEVESEPGSGDGRSRPGPVGRTTRRATPVRAPGRRPDPVRARGRPRPRPQAARRAGRCRRSRRSRPSASRPQSRTAARVGRTGTAGRGSAFRTGEVGVDRRTGSAGPPMPPAGRGPGRAHGSTCGRPDRWPGRGPRPSHPSSAGSPRRPTARPERRRVGYSAGVTKAGPGVRPARDGHGFAPDWRVVTTTTRGLGAGACRTTAWGGAV